MNAHGHVRLLLSASCCVFDDIPVVAYLVVVVVVITVVKFRCFQHDFVVSSLLLDSGTSFSAEDDL